MLTRIFAFVPLLMASSTLAQQPVPSAPASPPVAETAARPINPIVPPIQRVLPPSPKLDPRLSAKPVGPGKSKAAVAKSPAAKPKAGMPVKTTTVPRRGAAKAVTAARKSTKPPAAKPSPTSPASQTAASSQPKPQ